MQPDGRLRGIIYKQSDTNTPYACQGNGEKSLAEIISAPDSDDDNENNINIKKGDVINMPKKEYNEQGELIQENEENIDNENNEIEADNIDNENNNEIINENKNEEEDVKSHIWEDELACSVLKFNQTANIFASDLQNKAKKDEISDYCANNVLKGRLYEKDDRGRIRKDRDGIPMMREADEENPDEKLNAIRESAIRYQKAVILVSSRSIMRRR